MTDATRIPVIVATGEILHRPEDVALGLEPVVLMGQALERADAEAGGGLLADLDSLDLVGQITWRYADPVGLLCEKLGVKPARAVNASMGGETPIRLVHEAALRIARGEGQVSAIVGGESMHALGKARRPASTCPGPLPLGPRTPSVWPGRGWSSATPPAPRACRIPLSSTPCTKTPSRAARARPRARPVPPMRRSGPAMPPSPPTTPMPGSATVRRPSRSPRSARTTG